MTEQVISGIYKITFPSGKTYIGKSIDFYTRIKQHYDKFKKGTAAKPMQEQYNLYKTFRAEVVFECHPDHIDLMEAVFISRINPDLNTSRPADPFPGIHGRDLDNITDWFDKSTYDHAVMLNNNKRTIRRLQEECAEYIEELDELEKKRTEEEINTEAGAKLQLAIQSIEELTEETTRYKSTINSLKQHISYLELPWWKKFF